VFYYQLAQRERIQQMNAHQLRLLDATLSPLSDHPSTIIKHNDNVDSEHHDKRRQKLKAASAEPACGCNACRVA